MSSAFPNSAAREGHFPTTRTEALDAYRRFADECDEWVKTAESADDHDATARALLYALVATNQAAAHATAALTLPDTKVGRS